MGRVLDVKRNDRAERAILDARERLTGVVSAWRLVAEARRVTGLSERVLLRALHYLERQGILRRAKKVTRP